MLADVSEDEVTVGSTRVRVRTVIPLNSVCPPSTFVQWGDDDEQRYVYDTADEADRAHATMLDRLADFAEWDDLDT